MGMTSVRACRTCVIRQEVVCFGSTHQCRPNWRVENQFARAREQRVHDAQTKLIWPAENVSIAPNAPINGASAFERRRLTSTACSTCSISLAQIAHRQDPTDRCTLRIGVKAV